MDAVRVMWPRLPDAEHVLPYLRRMDAARTYSNFGPLASELEGRYAERFGVPAELVAVCANATVGLQGALEMRPGLRAVHVPTWTFPASPMAVLSAGQPLVFHDVREDDWIIDAPAPRSGEAVMPVLPFGAELDLARWEGWEHVVLDAAASGGAVDLDLSSLPRTWAVVISLHATKVLGAGEGGVVVFGDPRTAERFRAFTNIGFDGERVSSLHGVNGKLSEPAAAYALAALDQWEGEEREWRAARALIRAAEERLGLGSPCSQYPGVSPYWMVQFESGAARDGAEAALTAAGVETRRWWAQRCDRMPAFAGAAIDVPAGGFPVADHLVDSVLGLPFQRDLTAADVERVVGALLALRASA